MWRQKEYRFLGFRFEGCFAGHHPFCKSKRMFALLIDAVAPLLTAKAVVEAFLPPSKEH